VGKERMDAVGYFRGWYLCFLTNVNSRSRSLYAIARPSVCLSSVCNVRAPYCVKVHVRYLIS